MNIQSELIERANMDDKGHRDKCKLKSNAPVGIIPSNYAKSHRINSDLPHTVISAIKPDVVAAVKCVSTEITSDTLETPSSSALKVLDSDDDECLETDKKITPRKKNRRNKIKESDVNSAEHPPSKAEQHSAAALRPGEVTLAEEEPKPRIVLTFRSEKPGLRSSNMKIVSPDEKCQPEEANTRRSARFREKISTTRSPDESDDSNKEKSPNKSTRKVFLTHSESDEPADTVSPPPLKRSNRRRSKEFSENVLANAIARKEKSYNETTPTQRLITRRIKPTAKVLANRELKQSVESTNSARLGSDKSPEDGGVQTRRSARRPTPDARSAHHYKVQHRKQLTQAKKGKLLKNMEDSDDETLKQREQYLSVDEIKKCILGGAAPESKASLMADTKSSHDRENRRFNKLKKKHLSKLGLQAVSGVKVNVSASNENLTDDSTMDSTNTDAIVEHLNAQKKQIETEKQIALQEHEDMEMIEDIEVEGDGEEDSELMSLLKEELEEEGQPGVKPSDSDTSDEEFAYSSRTRPDAGATTMRVTRKRLAWLRLENAQHSTNSDHSDVERVECSSPAGGEEGSTAAAPGESAHCVPACLCAGSSNVYLTPDALTEPVFCGAVELVKGARVGCSRAAAREGAGRHAAVCRPSARVPYFLACSLHTAQLRRHLCCPVCGIFCTQGTFYQCSKGHLFHLECGVWRGGCDAGAEGAEGAPGCPHCGEDASCAANTLNRACGKVRVEMNCSNRQIFLPEQRLQCTPALMGFSPESSSSVRDEAPVPTALLPPAPVSLTSLRQRGEACTDYEELLTSSAEQRLAHAITHCSDAEHILTKLICGVDLHQALEIAEGGTFLHLAARHGNLTAAYLLHYAGCRLDVTDAQLRTPLMVAVSALLDNPKPNTVHSKTLTDKVITSKVGDNLLKNNTDDKNTTDVNAHATVKINSLGTGTKSADSKNLKNPSEGRQEIEEGIMSVIRYLVAAGCDVNFQGGEGVTALHLAAQHGGLAACEALLESHRARVDARDHGGWTPLVWAAENKHPHVVRLLLQRGADACSCDGEGNSVLHWCVLAGCSASLQLLLDAASPHAVDTVNPHGDTPLHVAARQDHYPCVVILLARGGRTDMKNSSRELAVDCAREETRTAISLNMQMSLMIRDRPPRHKLLSSDISGGREELAVSCVNELDETPLPSDFTYITRHVYPQYVRLHNTLASMQGCECTGELCGGGGGGGAGAAAGPAAGAACACCVLGVRRWYSEGRLVHNFPFRDAPMLFECNETCKCNLLQCPNAVVTRLSRRGATFVRAQVFRCGESRGWGLRALAPVLRGTAVALYCGELLKASVADTRPRDQYMFAMEVKQDLLDGQQCEEQTQLCVDAGAYGSAARFINHGCRANLAPVRVFTHSRDVRIPNIVLFAARNIAPLEEFTFNYGDKFWSVKSKFMRCCCGAPDCRYPPASPSAHR